MRTFAFALAFLGWAGVALAADQIPVAVLWLGDANTVEQGNRVAGDVYHSLSHFAAARALDSSEDRRLLVEGGAATREAAVQARADQAFVQQKCADAVKDYEAAEKLLLEATPIEVAQRRLGGVERNLLACYDRLGRSADATRAAERLGWTAGSNEDVQPLLDKYGRGKWAPAFAPSRVTTDPTGALVYRDLQPLGAAPVDVAGGDAAIDAVDVELQGYRRVHVPLGHDGNEIRLTLEKEDRVGELVDGVRARAPDAPPQQVAQLGRRVGAARVLALYPDGPKILARWLDVASAKWAPATIKVDANGGQPAMDRLAGYVAPRVEGGNEAQMAQAQPREAPVPVVVQKAPEKQKSKWGAWGKWYTWVAAGGVVLLVGGLLIAQNVGSDTLKITVTK